MSDIGNGPQQPKKWGKGKTDPATWWETGCKSPNPGGRPKGSKNQKTKYKEAFNKKLIINLDGEDKSLTFSELGYRNLVATVWFSLSGPPGMPVDIVNKLNGEVRRVPLITSLSKVVALDTSMSSLPELLCW